MQPLGPFELYLNIGIAVVFPLLLIANLAGRGTVRSNYLWRNEPQLMWVSLVIIAILAIWAMARVAVHFAVLPASALDPVMAVLGIPFLALAVAEIWLGVRALRRYRRTQGGSTVG